MSDYQVKLAEYVRGESGRSPFKWRHWTWLRLAILASSDVLIVAFTYYLSFFLRVDTAVAAYHETILATLPVVVVCHLTAYVATGMYRQIWRFANINSGIIIIKAVALGTMMTLAVQFVFMTNGATPRSIPFIHFFIASMMIAISKFSWRVLLMLLASVESENKKRCVVYGAGVSGEMFARSIKGGAQKFPYKVVGFIDDDVSKVGRVIYGLPVLGTSAKLEQIVKNRNISTVIICLHRAPGKALQSIVNQCQQLGVKPLIVPDMEDTLRDQVFQPRQVDIGDLLRRSPKSIDRAKLAGFFAGQTVVVTGAGGSIGSEICRQLLAANVETLVMIDFSEYALYKIQDELLKTAGGHKIRVELGSITSRRFITRVFEKYAVDTLLHAAAYKHVPILEDNPVEGIINNISGTQNLLRVAAEFKCKNFVQISTDKAVRPTNVMGATKRCCELLLQSMHASFGKTTKFTVVRFGNVLGSSGSVIPKFLDQIRSGGPVTVTHPEMTRFFMLIDEAVGLVLRAVTEAKGGEILVLDMGEPVKIYDMAKQLIHLAGKRPGIDIEVLFTGLRPGEKLYEELICQDETYTVLQSDVFRVNPPKIDAAKIQEVVAFILAQAEGGNVTGAISTLKELAGFDAGTNSSQNSKPKPPIRSAPSEQFLN